MRLNETKMQILMGEHEMNIRMLAERSGVSRQTISCIKAGKSCSPVVACKAIGKDAQYIRYGLQKGIFSFGYAIKLENSSEYNYYCPDRKVWEETGYFRQEDKKEKTLA